MRESSYEKQLPQCKGERLSDLKQSPGLVPKAKMKKTRRGSNSCAKRSNVHTQLCPIIQFETFWRKKK